MFRGRAEIGESLINRGLVNGGGEWEARERKDVFNFDDSAHTKKNSGGIWR